MTAARKFKPSFPLRRLDEITIPSERKRPLNENKARHLAESIAEIGLVNPVTITVDGVLVSGLHRLEACRLLDWEDVPVNVVQLDELRLELAEIDENLIRNELTVLERSEHLQRRMEIYEALHPETRNGATGRGRPRNSSADSAKLTPAFAEATSEATGRSSRVIREEVQIAKAINESFDESEREELKKTEIADSKTDLLRLARIKEPEQRRRVIEKIKSGEVASVLEAKTKLKDEDRQVAIATAPDSDDAGTVEICRIQDVQLVADSVDMVFTDPPYHDEYVELFGHLARLSRHALKPGGMCLVYVGKMYLPVVLAALCAELEYVWQFVVFHPFSTQRSNSRAIFENYRPILAFRKPGPQEHASKRVWVQDVVRGRREKEHHDWQQDEDAPRMYVEAYTKPGELVLDPFCGGGTTAAACKAIGRRFVCFDADEDAVKLTLSRLKGVAADAANHN